MRPEAGALPSGSHLDEGEAHAFVDGALGDAAAARVIAHVAGCEACAGIVAEARGLAAAATRILGALDEVPGGVVPGVGVPGDAAPTGAAASPALPTGPTLVRPGAAGAAGAARVPVGGRRPRRWTAWPVRAAAGLLLAAGVGSAAWRATRDRPDVVAAVADTAVTAPASAPVGAPAAAPTSEVASARAAGPPPEVPGAEPRRTAAEQARVARRSAPAARAADAVAVAPAPPSPAGAPPPPPAPVAALEASAAPGVAAPGSTVQKHAGPARDVAAAPDTGGRGTTAAADVAPAAPAAPGSTGDQLARRAAVPYAGARSEAPEPGAGAVSGVVLDAAGRPVAAAQVEADSGAARAVTGSDGRFVLGDLAAGEKTLRVRRIGFESARATVQVAARDTARAEVRLKSTALALSQVVVTGVAAVRAERAAGCYTVRATAAGAAAALPDRVLLRADAAGRRSDARRRSPAEPRAAGAPRGAAGTVTDAGGRPRGRWALGGDTLVLRWDDAAALVLHVAPDDGWAADGVMLERVGAPAGGCPPR